MAGTIKGMTAYIKARIDRGTLSPGDRLPPTGALMQQFELSEATVYRAISLLKAEGYVTAQQGKGVFVADRRTLITGPERVRGIVQPGETIHHLRSVRVQAPAWVGEHLGDGECVNRARVVKRGEQIKNVSQSWVHVDVAEVVPEVDEPRPCDPTWQAVYQERSGNPVSLTRNIFTSRKLTPEDREALGLGEDVDEPVTIMRSIYVTGDRVIGVGEAVAAPGEEITVTY